MSTEFDLIIMGGGCAGLSLASALSGYGSDAPRTLVLDGRPGYRNDRTWCFWQLQDTHALDLVQYRWQRFRVAGNQHDVVVNCGSQPYCAIPAEHFYRNSLSVIQRAPQISLVCSTPVLGSVGRKGDLWVVETPLQTYTSRNVVDTRPTRAPQRGDAFLWQSFLGVEVEVEHACFAAGEVTLMDFRHTPEDRIVFTYVLPFSPTRGLVEVTEFSPLPLPPGDLQPLVTDALRDLIGSAKYQTLRTESGLLPMGQSASDPSVRPADDERGSYVRAGVAGGGARACTGYAFQRIQRWAAHCAARLAEGGAPEGHPRDPYVLAWLDELFLRVLKENPNLAPRLFTQLFAAAPTASVLRFLSDQANPTDVLSVIAALPAGPFLKALGGFSEWPARWRELFAS